jgi:hypothetical protein
MEVVVFVFVDVVAEGEAAGAASEVPVPAA